MYQIQGVDRQPGELILRGTEQYPTGMASALNMIDCYVKIPSTFNPCNHYRCEDEEDNEDVEMTCVQTRATVADTNGILHESVTCFGCKGV